MKTLLRLLLSFLLAFAGLPAVYAQLPVAPNQYQPQTNTVLGVTGNLQPFYTPSWIGASTVTSSTVTLSQGSNTLQVLDATSNNVTVTLPSAINTVVGTVGKIFAFKAINVSNTITILPGNGDTIDGASSTTLTTLNQCLIVESDGSHTWRVITTGSGGGGGSGTVTNFSAGSLSPLFTTSVATSTTTPVLSFALSNAGAHTYLGNNTGSSTAPSFLTNTQVTADLNVFTSTLQGLVPGSGGGTSNFLRADGTWAVPPGTGGTGTVTSISTTSAPSWLSSTWANPTTTPAQTIGTPSGLTANQFVATPDGTTGSVGLRAITSNDLAATNVLTNTSGTAFQSINLLPSYWPNSRAQLNQILARTPNSYYELLCVGDSTTSANQDLNPSATPAATQTNGGYPRRLVEVLNSYGIPACEGWQGFDQYNNSGPDPRLTYGAFWSQLGTRGPDGNGFGIYYNGTAGTGAQKTWSYTPHNNAVFDTIKIVAEGTGGWGVASINVDGGSTIGTMDSNANAGNWFNATFTCPRGSHTLNVVGDGSAPFMIISVETYDSTTPSVHVANLGSTGSTIGGWVTNGTGNKTIQNLWAQWKAHGIINNLTINDASANTPPSTYQASYNSLITNEANLSIGTGKTDVICGTGIPTADPTIWARQQVLINLIKTAIAPGKSCPFWDWAGRWVSYAVSNPYQYYKADGIHGSFLGYYDGGWSIATMLTPLPASVQYTVRGTTTINGTAGTFQWSQPKQDGEQKKVIIQMTGYTSASPTVVTFQTPFTNTPATVFDNSSSTPTVSTTSISVPAVTTKTATIILEGL